jgi:proline iminopeptidase
VARDGRLVDVGDTRLFVDDRGGNGRPLLCIHGGPGADHHTFADYLDPLAPEVRLVLLDLRAHGRSADAPAETLTMRQLATDVVELARTLGLGEFAVLGHSFGASVALRVAVDHPAAPAALVLSAGTASHAALPTADERLSSVSPELRERLARERDQRAWFEAYLAACFADDRDERIPDYLRRRAPMVLRPDTAERMTGRGADCELADRLGEVCARTLVLHGRRDRITPLALGEQLARGIRGARLVVFERSGHFPFVEEQDAYGRALREFLSPPP